MAARSSSSVIKKLKKSLTVYIVEDHNEVLYYIYRGIGSKNLPFENGAIIHLDSHPDLLLPKDFEPQLIRDKNYVMDSVSIENWLLPLFYARHFDTLAWIKPPWAQQIEDGQHAFQIGTDRRHGRIRLTCPELYFVSELLYSTAEDLTEDKNDVNFVVFTLQETDSKSRSAPSIQEAKVIIRDQGIGTPNVGEVKDDVAANNKVRGHRTEVCNDGNSRDAKQKMSGVTTSTVANSHYQCGITTSPEIIDSEKNLPSKDTSVQTHVNTVGFTQPDAFGNIGCEKLHVSSEQRRPPLGVPQTVTQIDSCEIASENRYEVTDVQIPEQNPTFTPNVSSELCCPMDIYSQIKMTNPEYYSQHLPAILSSKSISESKYVLDIDLDFYSTQNPFLLILGEKCFSKLQDIYAFDPPFNANKEVLYEAIGKRREQLDELESILKRLENGDTLEDLPESIWTEKLKDLFHQMDIEGRRLDYSLIHDAGCTCDTSPLPHHITSLDDIRHLVDETGILLRRFPKPAMVTVARSSRDDYCPSHQVDIIQQWVLDMLRDLYGDLDVKHDYHVQATLAGDCSSQEISSVTDATGDKPQTSSPK